MKGGRGGRQFLKILNYLFLNLKNWSKVAELPVINIVITQISWKPEPKCIYITLKSSELNLYLYLVLKYSLVGYELCFITVRRISSR